MFTTPTSKCRSTGKKITEHFLLHKLTGMQSPLKSWNSIQVTISTNVTKELLVYVHVKGILQLVPHPVIPLLSWSCLIKDYWTSTFRSLVSQFSIIPKNKCLTHTDLIYRALYGSHLQFVSNSYYRGNKYLLAHNSCFKQMISNWSL